jgi:hypothetical protein
VGSVAEVADDPTMLALRTGAREVVCVGVGATDCRLFIIEVRGAVLGATTLEGRDFGGATAADFGLGGGFMGDAEVAGFGAGWAIIRKMLLSLMKRP